MVGEVGEVFPDQLYPYQLVSSSARVTSVKSGKFETTGSIDRAPGTPGSDKNLAEVPLQEH